MLMHQKRVQGKMINGRIEVDLVKDHLWWRAARPEYQHNVSKYAVGNCTSQKKPFTHVSSSQRDIVCLSKYVGIYKHCKTHLHLNIVSVFTSQRKQIGRQFFFLSVYVQYTVYV